MPCTPLLAFFVLALAPFASAHGYLKTVTIDGKAYAGNVPNGATNPSPIRQINDIGPVKGADNPFMNCGQAAQLASQVASANPGSAVQFLWKDGDDTNWPHNIGPLMTYMAPCTGTTCDKFNGTSAKWFKIDEIGKKPDGSTWYQQDVMNGQSISVTLPTDLAPGDYLVRHEIIALHLADSLGGASSTRPAPSSADNDPGIFDKNVFDPGDIYVFPGPPVSNLAAPSDSAATEGGQAPSGAIVNGATVTVSGSAAPPASTNTKGGSGGSSSASSKAPKTTSTPVAQGGASTGSGKQCNLQKRGAAGALRRRGATGGERRRKHARWSTALRRFIHHS
ncbi:hypothetical protein EVG20_g8534 [Dentipellis fragilis]|uniref:AA9 family lytic polysaccharide monooxygenase n=1 Tax=Dentipellis fragilis TaxID=205917 RepID=A0A4Y9Y7E0_9AGAM|nr:hypothetical protein EVG20_g8534 [Dentipellis fragilis]